MSNPAKILIGSNNAYSWYAALDADGALLDWGSDYAVCIGGESMRAAMQRSVHTYLTQWRHWESSWDDGDHLGTIEAALAQEAEGRCVEEALANGEALALLCYGGDVDQIVEIKDCYPCAGGQVAMLIQEAYRSDAGYSASGYLVAEDQGEETGPTVQIVWDSLGAEEPEHDADWSKPTSITHYKLGLLG
jgi:hypothetical protein